MTIISGDCADLLVVTQSGNMYVGSNLKQEVYALSCGSPVPSTLMPGM